MPTLYRSMKRAKDDFPIVGNGSRELGVRVDPAGKPDIDLDLEGNVVLNSKGMSVADHWQSLPPHLIPKRLTSISPGAAGSNANSCYRLGEGPFVSASISVELQFHQDSERHGVVAPAYVMQIDMFQLALASTRLDWKIDEVPRQ